MEAQARSLPAVEVTIDPEAVEARRFGVRTSGHIFFYGRDGRLLFSGGITAGRGQAGDCPGSRAVLACLLETQPETRCSAVYGCPLLLEDEG